VKLKMRTMFSPRFWQRWSLTMHFRDSMAVSNDESATVTISQNQRCPTRNTSQLLSRIPKGVTQSVSPPRMIHHERTSWSLFIIHRKSTTWPISVLQPIHFKVLDKAAIQHGNRRMHYCIKRYVQDENKVLKIIEVRVACC
jgi:hypothetical protein